MILSVNATFIHAGPDCLAAFCRFQRQAQVDIVARHQRRCAAIALLEGFQAWLFMRLKRRPTL